MSPKECAEDKDCAAKLLVCTADLDTSKKSAEQLKDCLGAVAQLKPVPAKPAKPIDYHCTGVDASLPKKVGHDCTCENPLFVAVPDVTKPVTRVCVPRNGLFELPAGVQKLIDDSGNAIPKKDFDDLKKRVDKLYLFIGDPNDSGRIDAFIRLYTSLLDELARLKAAGGTVIMNTPGQPAQKGNTFQVTPGANVQALYRGPAGWGATLIGELDLRFRFTPTSPFAVQLQGGAGPYLNVATGPATVVTEAAGVRWHFTDNHNQSFGLLVRSYQFWSSHAAGYEGVLKQQGVGYSFGGEFDYTATVFEHLRFSCHPGFGVGPANWFAGPGDLRHEPAVVHVTAGCSVGGQINF
ncbi:hypothetical protein KBC54_01015 [Patescibacteria group bacterium]|nr:hypothetical protein [Patescibacteria group bacterium]